MGWENILKQNITTVEGIEKYTTLTQEEKQNIQNEINRFPMSVTKYYMGLIDFNDPNDPIRKMAIPSGEPLNLEGALDTSAEAYNTKLHGMQHKYRQTALVLTTSACAMYCRHCFRRRLVGIEEDTIADINEVAAYLKEHPEINNVLLSGGDAFMMPTKKIDEWLDALYSIDSLDFIRFGTRTPVTFPQRITEDDELMSTLCYYNLRKQLYVVTHFNHPKEFTVESKKAVKMLQAMGVVVKNQTVLMKGINDDPQVLAELLRKVSSWGIIQHYIFQCRPVLGVKSKFQVSLSDGLNITQLANAQQNGLGKSADYTMSHPTGKIRILGRESGNRLIFQYKQAKNPDLIGRIFIKDVGNSAWLEDDLNLV